MRARRSGTPARAGSLRQPGAAASAARPQFPRPHSGLEDPVPPVPELPSRAPRCTHLACSTVQGCGPQPAGLGTSGNVWRHLDRPCCGGGYCHIGSGGQGHWGTFRKAQDRPTAPHISQPPKRVAWRWGGPAGWRGTSETRITGVPGEHPASAEPRPKATRALAESAH